MTFISSPTTTDPVTITQDSDLKNRLLEISADPDFDVWLDDTYGAIDVHGISFPASRILYQMDPVAYTEVRKDYQEQRFEDLLDVVYTEFPLPLALYLFRVQRGYENSRQRLEFLRDIWESLIYLLFALTIGECTHKQVPLKNATLRMASLYTDKLSDKINTIRRCLDTANRESIELNCSKLISDELLNEIIDLNKVRNEFSHTSGMSDAQATAIFIEYYPRVLTILEMAEELRNVTIMRYLSSVGVYDHRVEIFNGAKNLREIENIKIAREQLIEVADYLDPNLVIVRHDSTIYSLSPFVHFSIDNSGHSTDLCFYKRKESGNLFRFEKIGKAEPVDLDRSLFRISLDKIRSLLGTSGEDDA